MDDNQNTNPQNGAEQTETQDQAVDQVQPVEESPAQSALDEQTATQPEAQATEEQPATVESPVEESKPEEPSQPAEDSSPKSEDTDSTGEDTQTAADEAAKATSDTPGKWYGVHTYSGHENKVATSLKQRVETEGLGNKIFDVLVPTQDKIEIRNGKKVTVKEKIFPGYVFVRMILDDDSWLAIRTTQGVTSFVGAANKPTPIPDYEVQTIVKFMQQGGQPTYKEVISTGDTVRIVDGPFADLIGKATEIDKEKGKVKVLVSIFGRETPVELDFLQVAKL